MYIPEPIAIVHSWRAKYCIQHKWILRNCNQTCPEHVMGFGNGNAFHEKWLNASPDRHLTLLQFSTNKLNNNKIADNTKRKRKIVFNNTKTFSLKTRQFCIKVFSYIRNIL